MCKVSLAYRVRYDDRFLLIYFKCFLFLNSSRLMCTRKFIHSHAHPRCFSSFVDGPENYTAVSTRKVNYFAQILATKSVFQTIKTGNVLWNACKHYAIKNYEWLRGKILINIKLIHEVDGKRSNKLFVNFLKYLVALLSMKWEMFFVAIGFDTWG